MTRRVALSLVLLLVPVSAIAGGKEGSGGGQQGRGVRPRQFVPANELKKTYPGVDFQGDVRVEKGAKIESGSVLRQTGSKPLYVLSGSHLNDAAIVQTGNRSLILLNAGIEHSTVAGNGVVAKSYLVSTKAIPVGGRISQSQLQLGMLKGRYSVYGSTVTGGVLVGMARVRGSDVFGVVSAADDEALHLDGAVLEPLSAMVGKGFKVTLERPQLGQGGAGVLRVFDRQGNPRGAQAIELTWDAKGKEHFIDTEKPLNILGNTTEGDKQ